MIGVVGEEVVNRKLYDYFRINGMTLVTVNSKDQLDKVSGLVIVLNEQDQLLESIEWLVSSQKLPGVLVWIFSTIDLEKEKNILMDLGASGIVHNHSDIPYLFSMLTNTLSKFENKQELELTSMQETLRIDELDRSVIIEGEKRVLSKTEFSIFKYLYENKNRCVPYEQLINLNCFNYKETPIAYNKEKLNLLRVSNHIFRIRKKIGNSSSLKIETIRSVGYMLETNYL